MAPEAEHKKCGHGPVLRIWPSVRDLKLSLVTVVSAGLVCGVLAGLSWLSSPGRQVTIDLTTIADEDNAVPGRVATVPFDLGIGN